VEGLGLEAAGVASDPKEGVRVDDFLRTRNRHIFAAGDICSPYKFTHTADAQARIVLQNGLFRGRARMTRLTIPWATYTSPEIAHVGMDRQEAARRGIRVGSFIQGLDRVDRAILDGQTDGYGEILVEEGSDRIVGATAIAHHAGDLISEIGLAMTAGVGLGKIAATIHPYPTQAEVWKKIADAYNRTRLTPRVKGWMERWLAWTR
jgi:pyruvate/2-oxoglutarate dehydrogenase complex dihydrolipoamide dehydrogenase (E3) component